MFLLHQSQAQAPQAHRSQGQRSEGSTITSALERRGEAKPFARCPRQVHGTESRRYSGGSSSCATRKSPVRWGQRRASPLWDMIRTRSYTYHEFTSTGEAIDSKGTVNGDTFGTGPPIQDGRRQDDVRVTIKEVSKRVHVSSSRCRTERRRVFGRRRSDGHKVTTAAPAKKS